MTQNMGEFGLCIDVGSIEFSSAQMLTVGGKCEPLHGHNYQVAIELEGQLDADYFVVEVGRVKKMLKEICMRLDEHLLIPTRNPHIQIEHDGSDVIIRCSEQQYRFPRRDVVFLDLPNPSMEMLAYYICDEMQQSLRQNGYTNISAISTEVRTKPGQASRYRRVIELEPRVSASGDS